MPGSILLLCALLPMAYDTESCSVGDFHGMDYRTAAFEDNYCRCCHIPQSATGRGNLTALWSSRELDINTTVQHPYHQVEGVGKVRDISSYVCVNCHDGTQAKNMPFSSARQSDGSSKISPTQNPHPVFFDYPEQRTAFKSSATPLKGSWYRADKIDDLLEEGQVVCISCHDPHTSKLRVEEGRKVLCKTCHSK